MDDSTSVNIGTKAGLNTIYGTPRLNTFVGSYSGFSNTTGGENSFFGTNAGKVNTTGYRNSFFGYHAGATNNVGGDNSFFGNGAGQDNTEGIENSFFGRLAGLFNTTGSHNTFLGAYAGHSNTIGTYNTAIGYRALYSNTESGDGGQGHQEVAVGAWALENSKSRGNTAIGSGSLRTLTLGGDNTAVGGSSLLDLVDGASNTAVGADAMRNPGTTSSSNVAIGKSAGENTKGDHNTFVGTNSGFNLKQSHGSIFIGSVSTALDTVASNQIVIGANSSGIKDNSVVLGNEFIEDVYMGQDSGATVHAEKITLNEVNQVSNPTPGTIRWNGSDFQGWNGITWISLTGGAKVGELIDQSGNTYKTIIIGGQEWMAENLRVTSYREGTTIDQITNDAIWSGLTAGAWCYYDNNPGFNEPYGKLYNWFAVSGDSLCPDRWHVPTDADWNGLIDYLHPGMINPTVIGTQSAISGGRMKETSQWDDPNAGATNESGFSGVGTGFRDNSGMFDAMGQLGYWWTATANGGTDAFYRELVYFYGDVNRNSTFNQVGASVRCIRN
ncbi:MAG: hypothetical protein IPL46_07090 [Saprospiraceae bacterium]|nr:hypothetical protein [Saprospiraceae bacterium]